MIKDFTMDITLKKFREGSSAFRFERTKENPNHTRLTPLSLCASEHTGPAGRQREGRKMKAGRARATWIWLNFWYLKMSTRAGGLSWDESICFTACYSEIHRQALEDKWHSKPVKSAQHYYRKLTNKIIKVLAEICEFILRPQKKSI